MQNAQQVFGQAIQCLNLTIILYLLCNVFSCLLSCVCEQCDVNLPCVHVQTILLPGLHGDGDHMAHVLFCSGGAWGLLGVFVITFFIYIKNPLKFCYPAPCCISVTCLSCSILYTRLLHIFLSQERDPSSVVPAEVSSFFFSVIGVFREFFLI